MRQKGNRSVDIVINGSPPSNACCRLPRAGNVGLSTRPPGGVSGATCNNNNDHMTVDDALASRSANSGSDIGLSRNTMSYIIGYRY